MESTEDRGFDDFDDDFLSNIPLDEVGWDNGMNLCSPGNTMPSSQEGILGRESLATAGDDAHNKMTGKTTTNKRLSESQDLSSPNSASVKESVEREKDRETTLTAGLGTVPEEFPFPFTPYDIQVGFMKRLYETIDAGKIGIFESPTGTGKSLSLICGALRWLKDFEEKQRKELLETCVSEEKPSTSAAGVPKAEKQSHGELDWIADFVKKQEETEKSIAFQEEREQMLKREARLKDLRNRVNPKAGMKRKRAKLEEEFDELFKDAGAEVRTQLEAELRCQEAGVAGEEAGEEELVTEYHSDDEQTTDAADDADDRQHHVTKIYYCSRTHSQLAQFVREVMKSPYGEDTRVVSLGSRQNLCINESVKRLRQGSLMNDKCLELQKNKTSKKPKDKPGETTGNKKSRQTCPFYKQESVMEYKDRILVDIKDIEQLVKFGKESKACPYYGTRFAIPEAEVVALPYNTLLHKSTRESCGIQLRGHVVIIDEAHNLADTIGSVHSVEITGSQVTCAHSQLSQYMCRYQKRLKAKNLMYIRQILFILSSFIKYLAGNTGNQAEQQPCKNAETKLQTINDFLFAAQLDNLNLFKILRYCEKSQIANKLFGFVEKQQPVKSEAKEGLVSTSSLTSFLKELSSGKCQETDSPTTDEKTEEGNATLRSPLMHITAFLAALTNADKDGRIVVVRQGAVSRSALRFLLLNPAVYFADVAREARAVIVAGGTMQPLSEFKDQLFLAAGVSPDRILEFSCGHVIPKDHLLPIALARGPSGQQLDFTYQCRNLPQILDELGRVVYNVCNIVPGGVVVFFPSYEYEQLVHTHWEKHGFMDKIGSKKKIFREPKKSSQVDSVLADYSSCIKKHMNNKYSVLTGAVLFSVVGGKMSEGINFSDDLGRCVLVVGLPYPNIKSPELKEKMDYLNVNMPKDGDGRLAGKVHYENLCMKAVNQSIGRAIRHKEDYASIMLLDHRYLKPHMKGKLPAWIADNLQALDRFGPAFAGLRKFFAGKKASS